MGPAAATGVGYAPLGLGAAVDADAAARLAAVWQLLAYQDETAADEGHHVRPKPLDLSMLEQAVVDVAALETQVCMQRWCMHLECSQFIMFMCGVDQPARFSADHTVLRWTGV